jgi:hypothetical protein
MGILKLMLIFSIVISLKVNSIEISEVQSGYMCGVKSGMSFVCHDTPDIYLTDQSECTFNKKVVPCTWYGYSFIYTENIKGSSLQCTYNSSKKATAGNTVEITGKSIDSIEFELVLEKESGFFSNPLYSVYNVRDKNEEPEKVKWVCKADGKTVLDISLRFYSPALPF